MDRFADPAGKGRLMAEETSHYAVVAVDDEGRQLARLLDGYIAPQVARVMALLGVPDQMGETERMAEELASATGAAPARSPGYWPPPACTAWSPRLETGSSR
jgi:hypothetical protein